MGHESVFRSEFTISSRKEHHPVRVLQSFNLEYKIIRASWLTAFNDAREQERSRTDLGVSQQWQLFFTRFGYDVLGSVSCLTPNLVSKKGYTGE